MPTEATRSASPVPVLFLMSVSRDGAWMIASALPDVPKAPVRVLALPARVRPCPSALSATRTGRSTAAHSVVRPEHQPTLIFRSERGQNLPRLPRQWSRVAGRFCERHQCHEDRRLVYPGIDARQYVFERGTIQRNIYRIPLK
jgi:hypothetical protein